MLKHMIVAIQILSILACPLWCGAGVCYNDGSLTVQKSSTTETSTPSHRCACCCHRFDSQQNQNSTDHAPHAPCPEKASCQGICGGAIIEQPTTPLESGSFIAPALVVASDISALCPYLSFEPAEQHAGIPLYGRQLRIAQLSFLC